MKKWLLVTLFVGMNGFSLLGLANIPGSTFWMNSPLPEDLRAIVLDELTVNCAYGISEWGLKEDKTEVLQDGTYRVTFLSRYLYQWKHSSVQQIVILVKPKAEYSGNPLPRNVDMRMVEGVCQPEAHQRL